MPIERYDPHQQPNAEEWLATGETERTGLVADYHRDSGIELPNAELHASMHMIVETQIAMGGDMLPVRVKIRQLMAQGLDRHDAVHAVGSVLAQHIWRVTRAGQDLPDADERYFSALRRLSARQWLRSG
jgi:hypothetical protein